MNMRRYIGGALALALALSAGLTPIRAEETAHTHIWRTDWAVDDYHHWRGCADPACRTLVPAWAEGYSYHIYDSSRDPDCNVCGWVRAVDPGHTHTWGSGWSSDSDSHWRRCVDPDCPGVVPAWAEGYAAHVYDGSQDPDCNVCGWSRSTVLSHTHVWVEDWSGDSRTHWRACGDADCPGVVPGEGKDYAAHVYDSSQDPDCNVCGRSRSTVLSHTHVWVEDWSGDSRAHWRACGDADCPGVVPGEGKDYAVHVYDGSQDPDCNICGRTRVALPLSEGDLNRPAAPDAAITWTGRGRIAVRPLTPRAGDPVTVILTPEEHYAASALTVTGASGGAVETVSGGDGTWTFRYPGEEVKLHGVFLPAYQACARDGSCPIAACGDLDPDQWYHDGIHYCLDWELMNGYDPAGFFPDDGLSGRMAAQILYNIAGHPELPGRSEYESGGLWYDSAMAWAIGAGVMNADGSRRFSPEEDVTREQLAVMLWRCAGCPSVSGWSRSFADAGTVTPWMEEAVRWAADQGILQGRTGGLLDPGGRITRAEAAAMLVRFQLL